MRPAAAPGCGRDLEDARALLPPSRGPQRASRRAWGAPDVSVLFYSYSPAGASLLGAVFSGTNSPSAPARRRARGWKGEWPEPGRGRRSCPLPPLALCGGAKAGSGAGSPEVGRFHHEVGGASVFSPGSPKRQRPSSLGPDPVSSPSVALLGGMWKPALTPQLRARDALRSSSAEHGVGLPVDARRRRPWFWPLTRPPGHPGSPRRRRPAGVRGAQAGSLTRLRGAARRPPSCPAAARLHRGGRPRASRTPGRSLGPAAFGPRGAAKQGARARGGGGGRAQRTPGPAGRRAGRRGAGRPF